MNKIIQWVIGAVAVLALILSLMSLVGGNQSAPAVAGTTNLDTLELSEDLIVTDDITVLDDLTVTDDVTISGGSVTITTSNTATSTVILGCIQQYATSTATPIRFEISTTTSLATYSGGSAPNGGVSWRYGTCPI